MRENSDVRAIRLAAEIQVVVGAGKHRERSTGRELTYRGNREVGQELARQARVALLERAGSGISLCRCKNSRGITVACERRRRGIDHEAVLYSFAPCSFPEKYALDIAFAFIDGTKRG
jgi:hypothetical protein